MKQSDSRKCHYHPVFITGLNNQIIPYGSPWLGNIFYTALLCTFNIVAEGEEGVRTNRYIAPNRARFRSSERRRISGMVV